jgi:hypothetical protein
VPPEWHLEGIKLLIAAKRSRDEERAVDLDELKDDDGFNGKEYADHYRAIAARSNPEAYLAPPLEQLLRERPLPRTHVSARARALGLAKKVARRTLGDSGVVKTKKLVKRALGQRGISLAKRVLS